jgi:hypothetical protein
MPLFREYAEWAYVNVCLSSSRLSLPELAPFQI